MRSALLYASIAVAIAAAVACGDAADDGNGEGADPNETATGPAGSGLSTGLPCGVQALLENRCIACHNGSVAESPRLLDYADLVAPSKSDPTKTMAQAALARLRSTTSPMPPPPAAPPEIDEINTLETWLILGT